MALQKVPFKKTLAKCANPNCGKTFIKKKANQRYCCLSCASRHNRMKDLAKRRPKYNPKFCEWCDKWFVPTQSGQKYCCPECREEAAKYQATKRLWKKIHPDKRVPDPGPQREPEPQEKSPAATMDEVLAYMKEHNCQYRRAVQALEGIRN